MQQKNYKELIIREVVTETDEMRLFYLEQTTGERISFKAGQYLTFVFQDGEQEARRSYSLASSPLLQEPLFIGIKRIPNGSFSRRLFDQGNPGDVLVTTGPGGVFVLPDDIHLYQQIFFFAAGSGIVPIYSLIKTVLHSAPHIDLVLIYSNKSIQKAAFFKPLTDLQKSFSQNFHIEFLFSSTEDLLRARLHADLVATFLQKLSKAAPEKCLYYICGPESYMRFCTFILQSHRVQAANIRKEIFHTSRPTTRIEPPDKAAYMVTVRTTEKDTQLTVQYPTTILQAARKQGLTLPYSCEVGRCGNCMAKCLKGQVWMSYNEVLTERELEKGFVLTCTGFPVSGDVILQI